MPEDSQTAPPPALIHALVCALDALTEWLGRTVAWLAPIMVLITCTVVLMRYGLGQGSVALQESVTYMHAALFMLGAGYALKHHKQVRVDILYNRFQPEGRAWIDALGGLLFLIPLAVFIGWISQDFVRSAWRIREVSADSGGLPWVYLLKTLIPLLAVSLMLQAVAEVLRSLLQLMGYTAPISSSENKTGAEEC